MDFKSIFKLKTERFWWVDAVFYFTVSLLVATIFCYVIFLVKNDMQRLEIKKHEAMLQDIGTKQQKEYEKAVLSYQKKIKDFSILFENHEFASRSFEFMQDQTIPEVWFKQFNLERKGRGMRLLGEANNMESFSRQVAIFENNPYVESVTALNSELGASASVVFNISMDMSQELFGYVSQAHANQQAVSEALADSSANVFETSDAKFEKKITVFYILLSPEVIGSVDQNNNTITVDVPYGTDVTNLIPFIITSPEAIVVPGSSVAQDFSRPVIYKVAARDGSVQAYTVTVNVLPEEPKEKNKYLFIYIYIISGAVVIALLIAFSVFFTKKLKGQKNNEA